MRAVTYRAGVDPEVHSRDESMRLRLADSPAAAIAADLGAPGTSTACRTIARFIIDAYALACEARQGAGRGGRGLPDD